jgi:hypothetical protein
MSVCVLDLPEPPMGQLDFIRAYQHEWYTLQFLAEELTEKGWTGSRVTFYGGAVVFSCDFS